MTRPVHKARPDDTRLGALHGLRGLAAVGVAGFFHFQHFGGNPAAYPFAQHIPFGWLYVHGFLLVDLFFVLSGVIFTYRYLSPVATGKVTGRQFFLLRFSRLYPLHVITLVFCACVEWTLLWRHQPPVVYERRGLYDFVLQALYLHTAFFSGWAFNAPSWSVGAEILAYLSFFLLASRHRKHYVALSMAICVVALGIQSTTTATVGGLLMLNGNLACALIGFQLGSLGYLAVSKLEEAGHTALPGRACFLFVALIAVLGYRFGYDAWIGDNPAANMLAVFFPLVFACTGFGPLKWLLQLRPLGVLGDLSYAIYLMHVPVQMMVLAVAQTRGIDLPTDNPTFLLGYLGTVVLAAALIHYWVEVPCSRWLRQRYGQAAPRPARPVEEMSAPPIVPAATP